MMNNKIKVFIIEDHNIMRRGLASLLKTEMDLEIIGEACSGEESLEMLNEVNSSALIILDLSLPGMNGIETTRKLKELNPDFKVLILTMYDNPIFVHQAIEAGASGYIIKKALVEELRLAINAAIRDDRFISPSIYKASDILTLSQDFNYKSLTSRELEVLTQLTKGLSVNEIADTLCLSIYTVYTHIRNIKHKVGIEKTKDLIRFALENHLVISE